MTDQRVTIYHSDDLAASKNPVLLYLNTLSSKRSKDTMRQGLDTVARLLTDDRTVTAVELGQLWANLRREHTIKLNNDLAAKYAPATANRLMVGVKQVLKECWRLGLIPVEDYQRAVDIPSVKGKTLPAGRDISHDEIAKLLRICEDDPHPAGVRDAAIIAVLWSGGLRRAELTALQLADYLREDDSVRVMHGKGNKAREVPLDLVTIETLEKWIAVRGDAPGPLWYKFTRPGKMLYEAISSQGVYDMIKRRIDRAGVAELSPHDFRRSAIGDLLDAGADIATVQQIVGHESVDTTSRYDRRPKATRLKAARLRRLPGR